MVRDSPLKVSRDVPNDLILPSVDTAFADVLTSLIASESHKTAQGMVTAGCDQEPPCLIGIYPDNGFNSVK